MTLREEIEKEVGKIVCDLFGMTMEHITEAPKWCGGSYDEACEKENCEIVKAVALLTDFTLAQAEKAGHKAREDCAGKDLSDHIFQILDDHQLEGYHIEGFEELVGKLKAFHES